MQRQNSYTYEELIECGHGKTFGEGNAKLPLPPMLMFDRIVSITSDGGKHGKGQIIAELDVRPDLWFFDCHFEGDPVMPCSASRNGPPRLATPCSTSSA